MVKPDTSIVKKYESGLTIRTGAVCGWGEGADVMIYQHVTGDPNKPEQHHYIDLDEDQVLALVSQLMTALAQSRYLSESIRLDSEKWKLDKTQPV